MVTTAVTEWPLSQSVRRRPTGWTKKTKLVTRQLTAVAKDTGQIPPRPSTTCVGWHSHQGNVSGHVPAGVASKQHSPRAMSLRVMDNLEGDSFRLCAHCRGRLVAVLPPTEQRGQPRTQPQSTALLEQLGCQPGHALPPPLQ